MANHPDFPMVMSEQDVEQVVREVTDEEAAHYREFGWVMMRGLVEPAFVDGMLCALREYEGDFKGNPAKNGVEPYAAHRYHHLLLRAPLELPPADFRLSRSLTLSPSAVLVAIRWLTPRAPPSAASAPSCSRGA
jgi:hypothetical protein